jgi:hypothetical protein
MQIIVLGILCIVGRMNRIASSVIVGIYVAMILFGVLVMSACQPLQQTSITFSSFRDLCGLKPDQFGTMDNDAVLRWIEDTYQIAPQKYDRLERGVQVITYDWVRGDTRRSAVMHDSYLSRLTLENHKSGATLGQVLKVFNLPASVSGGELPYEKVSYSVGLDYPSAGLIFVVAESADASSLMHNGKLAVQLKENLQASYIHCFKPSVSMDQVLQTVFLDSPEDVEAEKKGRVPWPGFDGWVYLDQIQ